MFNIYIDEKRKKEKVELDKKKLEMKKYKAKLNSKILNIKSYFFIKLKLCQNCIKIILIELKIS